MTTGKSTDYYRTIGSKGGKVKSQAKVEAARANGKRGGRPKGKSKESR